MCSADRARDPQLRAFEQAGRALAAADAHRDDARSVRRGGAARRARVAVSFAPVQPSGWPSAIAPPLTLTLSSGMPSSRWQYTDWLANASLSSNRSMSAIFRLVFASSFCTAGSGPMPMISGSTPTVTNARNTPSGLMPSSLAFARVITSARGRAVGDRRAVAGRDAAALRERRLAASRGLRAWCRRAAARRR